MSAMSDYSLDGGRGEDNDAINGKTEVAPEGPTKKKKEQS
jgi:hypothetical protein